MPQLPDNMNQASTTLATAPIELAGDWGRMMPNSALHVVQRMRRCCYDGVRLVSDDQPERLRVEEHTSGPPAVWLHTAEPNVGWIIDIGERDWSKLAYQFGHELGHVTCNSWRPDAKPAAPCQWLEDRQCLRIVLRKALQPLFTSLEAHKANRVFQIPAA